jgi:hypothetical protein
LATLPEEDAADRIAASYRVEQRDDLWTIPYEVRWNFGSSISPVRIRLARPSIRSTLGCGSLGTGAVGPDVVVAVMAERAIELRRQES